MALVFSESGTLYYDSVKGYYNPQTGEVYGANPPVGGWRGQGDPLYQSGIDQTNTGQWTTSVQVVDKTLYGVSTNANQQSSQSGVLTQIQQECAALTDPTSSYAAICRSNNAPMPNLGKGVQVSTNAMANNPTPTTSSLSSSLSSLFSGNKGLLIGAIVIGAFLMMGGEERHHGYN